jgi:HAMP domain-containing protein
VGFLNPWFLAGIVGVGLPVWLHLLKRHKTDPKPFPSLMFFEHREQSSVQHRRLDYILLFILRLLMILLLVLLFANPYINRLTPKGAGQKLVVVAVDRSFSMRTKEGTSDRLELAKNEALGVLSKLPPGQKAQVVALANTLQAMTQQTSDPNELRGGVISIQESDSRASYGELARYLRTLSENTKTPIEVHLVSDMQKSAMPAFADMQLAEDTDLVYHPIGKVQPNWTVESVKAPQHIYDPKKARVQATIAGFQAPAATRTVTLIVNGKSVQSKSVDVPANGRGLVEFAGLEASYGFNKCEVRIDSADNLPQDDRFEFATERTDPKKILFLDDGVHPNAETYFRTALEASGDAAFQVDFQRAQVGAGSDLSGFALVVLSDLGQAQMPQGFEAALTKYVTAGGAVLEALGPASVQLVRAPVLDEAIQGTRFADRNELFMTVSDVDDHHPALANVVRFDGVKFYQAVRVATTEGKSTVLARLGDGTPLVIERKLGQGDVLAFTSTFDDTANDFAKHGAWVSFVVDSVRYLGGGGVEEQVNRSVDSYVELRTGDQKSGAASEVLDPDGNRVLSLEEAAKARNFELGREGFYEIKNAAGRRSLVAAHADRRESDLAMMGQDSLDLWKATGTGTGPGGGPAGTGGEANTKPWSLSPIILLLLLGVALVESVVANGYIRPAAHPQEAK